MTPVASGWAIDCFKCVSIDGDNKPCDDPFHNNGSLAFLESPCLGGRKGRDGLFPATACIKIAGIYGKTSSFCDCEWSLTPFSRYVFTEYTMVRGTIRSVSKTLGAKRVAKLLKIMRWLLSQ